MTADTITAIKKALEGVTPEPVGFTTAEAIKRKHGQFTTADMGVLMNVDGRWANADVPLYAVPPAPTADSLPDVGQWTDDDRARAWRDAFDTMHQRAMKAEAALSTDAEPVELPYHCDVCTAPGYGDAPCSPLCDRQQPAPSVAVKALEWEDNVADAITGDYWIVNATQKWLYREPATKVAPFDTIEAAKEAAQTDYEARIRSALSAQVQDVAIPDGWQLVPKEPTKEMKRADAGTSTTDAMSWNAALYRAMLAAAPAAKLEEKP